MRRTCSRRATSSLQPVVVRDQRPGPRRGAFSLLEVILAMSILLGAIVVLGELARIGRRNASLASALSEAQRLAQNRLAEVVAGAEPLQPLREGTIDGAPGWVCSMDVAPTHHTGLVSVRLAVKQDLPEEKQPVEFVLARWVRKPDAARHAAAMPETPPGPRTVDAPSRISGRGDSFDQGSR